MRIMLSEEMERIFTDLIGPMSGDRLLETGTGYGESALFFSALKPDWRIYTIDGFGLYGDGRIYDEWNNKKIKSVQDMLGGKNIVQIIGASSKIPWELPINVLYLDADHTYIGVKSEYDQYFPLLTPGGLLIMDDYTQSNNPNNGVKKFADSLTHEIIHKSERMIIFRK